MVVQKLLSKGYTCVGTDRVPFPSSPVEFFTADLCDLSQVEKVMEGVTGVIHLAAVPGPAATVPVGCDPEHAKRSQIGLETMDPRQVRAVNVRAILQSRCSTTTSPVLTTFFMLRVPKTFAGLYFPPQRK
jgi:hypothetical protein